MARSDAWKTRLENLGARWDESRNAEVVSHFGDPETEYQQVHNKGLGLIDRGERETLVVRGEETIPWLQGLITNDLHDLIEEGSGQRTAVVNQTGRFISDARLLHLPRLLVVDLEPGTLEEGLLSHLQGQIILEDVELDDRSASTTRFGLYGERAAEVLDEFADWEHDVERLPPFFGTWSRYDGSDLIVQRVVWADIPGYEVWCDVDVVDEIVADLVEQIGEPAWFGREVFERLRVESGVPRFGAELDDKVIPLEAGFDDAIAYDKGCYLGQEIIARLDTRGTPAKKLRRVILDGDEVPSEETSIYPAGDEQGERAVGEVETAVYSPRFDAPVALAYIKRKHNDVGNRVRIDESEGRLEALLDMTELE